MKDRTRINASINTSLLEKADHFISESEQLRDRSQAIEEGLRLRMTQGHG